MCERVQTDLERQCKKQIFKNATYMFGFFTKVSRCMRNRDGDLVKTRFMWREFDRKCRVRFVVGSTVKRKSLFLLLSGLGIFSVSLLFIFLPLYPYNTEFWFEQTSNVPNGMAFIFTQMFDSLEAIGILL